ncbi:hypothetical protein QJQ45_023651 [Haematococcus lacustris]|nr:hypothetical protein QJQ45_023651 [Haematococcus lacustris]
MQSGVQLAPRSLIVSLDIGTHGSGFAFATKTPSGTLTAVRPHEHWPDQPVPYPKTRSALLYNGRSPVAWGHTAIRKLCALCDEGQDISQYRLVKDFKLALHDPKRAAELQAVAPGLTPEIVMADFLTFMRKYVIEQLVEEVGSDAARLDNIHWCLTVPAMWTERNKAAMRTAALRAGLIRKAGSDALTIILEPEAAAMDALDKQDPPLVEGMSLMVVDAGAGTVDVTIHNCQERGGQVVLSEAICAEGALCGSLFVDKEFSAHYRAAVGTTAFDAWVAQHPAGLQELMDEWEAVKCSFLRNQNDLADSMSRLRLGADDLGSSETFRVPITLELVDLMSKEQRSSLKQQQHGLDSKLVLSSSVMRQLFKGPVDAVCRLAVSQLMAARSEGNARPCSTVLLVGGFARNRYLQARVRAAVLGSGLAQQVVPHDVPHAAVLDGAVKYGFHPTRIHARRSLKAYGVRTCAPWIEGAPGKIPDLETGIWLTNSYFLRFVEKGELVLWDKEVEHTFLPLFKVQDGVVVPLYACNNNSTRFVKDGDDDMELLGRLRVDLPEDSSGDDRDIVVKFKFGKTQIHASAHNAATGSEDDLPISFEQEAASHACPNISCVWLLWSTLNLARRAYPYRCTVLCTTGHYTNCKGISRMDIEPIYCAEQVGVNRLRPLGKPTEHVRLLGSQIVVSPDLADVLKAYTKEVIRRQPQNLIEFSAKYFQNLANVAASVQEAPAPSKEQLQVFLKRAGDTAVVTPEQIHALAAQTGMARSIVAKVLSVGKFESAVNIDKFLFLLLVMSCESFGAVLEGLFFVFGSTLASDRFQLLISYLAPDMPLFVTMAGTTASCRFEFKRHTSFGRNVRVEGYCLLGGPPMTVPVAFDSANVELQTSATAAWEALACSLDCNLGPWPTKVRAATPAASNTQFISCPCRPCPWVPLQQGGHSSPPLPSTAELQALVTAGHTELLVAAVYDQLQAELQHCHLPEFWGQVLGACACLAPPAELGSGPGELWALGQGLQGALMGLAASVSSHTMLLDQLAQQLLRLLATTPSTQIQTTLWPPPLTPAALGQQEQEEGLGQLQGQSGQQGQQWQQGQQEQSGQQGQQAQQWFPPRVPAPGSGLTLVAPHLLVLLSGLSTRYRSGLAPLLMVSAPVSLSGLVQRFFTAVLDQLGARHEEQLEEGQPPSPDLQGASHVMSAMLAMVLEPASPAASPQGCSSQLDRQPGSGQTSPRADSIMADQTPGSPPRASHQPPAIDKDEGDADMGSPGGMGLRGGQGFEDAGGQGSLEGEGPGLGVPAWCAVLADLVALLHDLGLGCIAEEAASTTVAMQLRQHLADITQRQGGRAGGRTGGRAGKWALGSLDEAALPLVMAYIHAVPLQLLGMVLASASPPPPLAGPSPKLSPNQEADQGPEREGEPPVVQLPSKDLAAWLAHAAQDPSTLAAVQEWQLRLVYLVYESLGCLRLAQMFDIVVDYRDSQPAVQDMAVCLQHTHLHARFVSEFKAALTARLLHAGAPARDIVHQYVATIRVLREIDPSGALLAAVSGPLRAYLRGRADTARCVVALVTAEDGGEGGTCLLEEPPQVLMRGGSGCWGLVDDAAAAAGAAATGDAGPLAVLRTQRMSHPPAEAAAVDATGGGGGPQGLAGQGLVGLGLGGGHLPDKAPGAAGSSADIVAMLIGVFESKDVFINEYRSSLAAELLYASDFNTSLCLRAVELLKLRFGEGPLHNCEVMVKDIADSKRTNSQVHAQLAQQTQPLPSLPHIAQPQQPPSCPSAEATHAHNQAAAAKGPNGVGGGEGGGEGEAVDMARRVLSATIMSHIFWPKLGGWGDEEEKASSVATDRTKEAGLKLPPLVAAAQEAFAQAYAGLKAPRKLHWKPHLGCVELQVEVDGVEVDFKVSPVLASILQPFEQHSEIPAQALADMVGLPLPLLRRRAQFWITSGILQEARLPPSSPAPPSASSATTPAAGARATTRWLPGLAGRVQRSQSNGGGSTVFRRAVQLDPQLHGTCLSDWGLLEEAPALPSATEGVVEELSPYLPYINSMLTNYNGLPLDRLHAMLKLFVISPKYDKSVDQLAAYLTILVASDQLVLDSGQPHFLAREISPKLTVQPSSLLSGTVAVLSTAKMQAQKMAAPVRGRSMLRVAATSSRAPTSTPKRSQASALSAVPGVGPKLEALLKTQGCTSVDQLLDMHHEDNSGDAEATKAWLMDVVGIRTKTTAKGIVDYIAAQRTRGPASQNGNGNGNGATSPQDAVVLGVLQNYSGLTSDRLFNMLKSTGRFNESQSALASILRSLTSQGKVQHDNGTYRFVSGARAGTPAPARSPSPVPSRASPNRVSSPNPTYRTSVPASRASAPSAGGGSGASSSDEQVVLSILQNYSGLSPERLSAMVKNSGKSVSNLNGVVNSLVSSGKVQNDKGTLRFVSTGRAATPAAARTSSPARPSSAPTARASTPSAGGGGGASSSDEQVVLSILQNYSGLTAERLANMVKNSGKSVSNLNGVVNSLVSSGKVQNDKGTFRFVSGSRAASPMPRQATPAARSSSAPAFRAATPSAGSGSGASSSDEQVVLSILQNYSGLTPERLSNMVRNSGKSVSNLNGVVNSLVSSGKVQNDKGTLRFVSSGRAATPAAARTSSPARASVRPSSAPTPRASTPSAGGGGGASSSDEQVVLSILQNYSGLTAERLANMVKNSGKSVSNLNGVVNSLVSSGKVQNDKGTFRFVSGSRAASPMPRQATPAARSSSAPAFRAATPSAGSGSGASSSDEQVVLSILMNYSGLTPERLSNMIKNSGKNVSNLNGVIASLVSSGKVQNDKGTFRFVSSGRGSTPAPARSASPAPVKRSTSALRTPSPAPGGGGALPATESAVLSLLMNYSSMTADRAHRMMSGSGQFNGSESAMKTVLNSLVSKGKAKSTGGAYSFVSK